MPDLTSIGQSIIENVPVVGNAISTLTGILNIRGRTQQLSNEEVLPEANKFRNAILPYFERAYTPEEQALIAEASKNLFLNAMRENWGLAKPLNIAIAQTIVQTPTLANELGNFFLWIATNIDKARPETLAPYVASLFDNIFVNGITTAGLNPKELGITGGNILEKTKEQPSTKQDSFTPLVGIGGLLYFLFSAK